MSLRTHTITVTLILLLLVVLVPQPVPAVDDLKSALVGPLSGRWARQGQLKKMGAEMAIAEINAQGGIKALGGAKIVLREADAGDSVEKAVSAAQRVLSREKISAGIGAWLSSFTLGVTEVAERLEVPWFTLSYADSITERGFKYTFQTSPVSSLQAEQALDLVVDLAKRNKQTLRKAAIVGDNTAATVFFFKPLREKLLKAKGIEIVVDEIWTPPLADATAIVQKVRSTQPDIVFYGATNFPDSIQVLQKVKEFGLNVPIQGVGAWLVTPEYVKTVGKELLDNIMTVTAAHPLKGQEDRVLRHERLARALREALDQILLALERMGGGHGHDVVEQLLAHRLDVLRRHQPGAHPLDRHLQAELLDLLEHLDRVREVGGAVEDDVRLGRAHLLDDGRRVRERRRPDLVHDDLDPFGLEELLAQRLEEKDGGGGVVADDRRLPERLLVALRQINDQIQRLLGLQRGDRTRLECVLEAALRDRVGVGEREPRHLEPLGHLGDAEGEGAEPRADPRADLLARQHALGRAHRLLHAVARIPFAQDDLGAAERLDPALGVDLRDGHLRAHLLELALARPPAGERRHQRDLEVVGRGRDGRGEQHRGRDEHGQQDREWLHRSSPHV